MKSTKEARRDPFFRVKETKIEEVGEEETVVIETGIGNEIGGTEADHREMGRNRGVAEREIMAEIGIIEEVED